MENTAKNFALQLGSLISLYVSIGALITLLFGIITVQYPDVAQGYWEAESATLSIRWGIALLAVFFPAYCMLTHAVHVTRRNDAGAYLSFTKRLIYLSLLIGGVAMLVDLVVVINGFLNGELTIRFALKALSFLIVVGSAFTYYLYDARGYWREHGALLMRYGVIASIFVATTLVFGFMRIEPPDAVREMKLDAVQITDLQNIQSRIFEYYQLNAMLPKTLDDAFRGIDLPSAPENRTPYTYTVKDTNTIELCATFAYPTSKIEEQQYVTPYYDEFAIKSGNNWIHAKGEWCFLRVFTSQPNIKQIPTA